MGGEIIYDHHRQAFPNAATAVDSAYTRNLGLSIQRFFFLALKTRLRLLLFYLCLEPIK